MEIVTVYFEDPSVRACMMNHAVQHGVWGFTLTHEREFRTYAALREQHLASRAERFDGSAPCGVGEACGAGKEGSDDGASRSDSASDDGSGWSCAAARAQLHGGGNREGRRWTRHAFATAAAFLAAALLARK